MTTTTTAPKRSAAEEKALAEHPIVRVVACGSVDDGKSTLIGRLLAETESVPDDILDYARNTRRSGSTIPKGEVDFSMLTDGLEAEHEQGITIDVAYRHLYLPSGRRAIIADAPGHEQYTRNMATAASTADAAVLLIDARKGVLPQTRRHATIAALLGIRQLILAVNKMDLIGWSQATFDAIVADFRTWLAQHPELIGTAASLDLRAVPLSALEGDMVVERGESLPWYRGPTLVELLEDMAAGQSAADAPLRLPVQWVCRPSQADVRAYAGRLEAGRLSVGDEVRVLPSGLRSRVTRIALGENELPVAVAGRSVLVSLADEIDVSRGDLLVLADDASAATRRELTATLCWLHANPLAPARTYLLRHTTRDAKARIHAVDGRLDIHDLTWGAADASASPAAVGLNDIARVRIRTQQPLALDAYRDARTTGSFILIDEATNETVAAGVVV
jgi:sulfate adenylyltransferase subunit 1